MKKRNSKQQARLFMMIMQEAQEETGMNIAMSDDKKLYIVDSITGDRYELDTVCCEQTTRKSTSKKHQKYSSPKK